MFAPSPIKYMYESRTHRLK